MEKFLNIVKRIVGTIALPLIVYIIMYLLTHAYGKDYFGGLQMWRELALRIGISVTCAMGIGLQFKSGRFDFSGGAIMLLTGIISTNVAKAFSNSLAVYIVLTMVCALVFSLLVSFLYVFGRLLVVITTIGMALLFEAITPLIFNGKGINIVANEELRIFSTFPFVLIPLIVCVIIYWAFSYVTVTGKQSLLLSRNQLVAVNIGIKERKNVILSYVFSGLIFGCATLIYCGVELQRASFSSLTTVGALFSNILPVFIGLMLIGFCGDTIGIIMGSLTLTILAYGLKVLFQDELGAAITLVVTGIFVFGINVASARGGDIVAFIKRIFKRQKVSA